MKFELSEDQALLRTSTRDFLAAECPLEKSRRVMEHDARGYEPAMWKQLAEMGYLGLTLPATVGGQDLGAIELAIVLEEMGRACLPGPYLDAVLAATVLAAAGGQDALLKDVAAGRTLVTIAREDSIFSGTQAKSTRFEGGRVRGQKYFVPRTRPFSKRVGSMWLPLNGESCRAIVTRALPLTTSASSASCLPAAASSEAASTTSRNGPGAQTRPISSSTIASSIVPSPWPPAVAGRVRPM